MRRHVPRLPARALPRQAALALTLAVAFAASGLAAAAASAASSATQVSVTLYASRVQVRGSTQATATVTDATGAPVAGDEVDFSSDGGQTFSSSTGTTDSQGRVTVKVTATPRAGTYTISATDPSPPGGVTGRAQFTQSPGPPAALALTGPTPGTVLADGRSSATVVATLTDADGNLVPGEPVAVTVSDGGDTVTPTPAADNGDGTYTALITSSLTPGTATVTATDTTAPSVTASGTVTQSPWPVAHVELAVVPPRLSANGVAASRITVTLSDDGGRGRYGDAAAIELTASDPGASIGPLTDHGDGTYTATLTASRRAQPVTVTATERASGRHASDRFLEVPGPARTVRIHLTSPVLTADGLSVEKAFVHITDAAGNPVAGDRVRVSADSRVIVVGRAHDHHNGTYAVRLASTSIPGRVTLTATDLSVHPAATGRVRMTVIPAPALATHVTMLWSFRYTPWWTYYRSFYLLLDRAPSGAVLTVSCHGAGCPYATRTTPLPGDVRCGSCRVSLSLGLTRPFVEHLLAPGSLVTAKVTRRGWSGKMYSFAIGRGRPPTVTISCLPPGRDSPGAGCT